MGDGLEKNLALTEAGCPPPHRRKVPKFTEFFLVQHRPIVTGPYSGAILQVRSAPAQLVENSDGLRRRVLGFIELF